MLFKKSSCDSAMPLKYLKLKKADISRLQFILEGYEGFATATTIDKNIAVVKLFIVPDFVEETENLLSISRMRFNLRR